MTNARCAFGSPPQVARQVDPTVCVNCRRDSGATELPKLIGLPVCGSCEAFFRHRPSPLWIKAALVAVVVLVVVSLVCNLRFFRGDVAVKRFEAYSAQGNFEAASSQMSAAGAWERNGGVHGCRGRLPVRI